MTPSLPFRLGGFGTIAADPPWPYDDQANRMRCDYPTMSVDEICALPVASIASTHAHLYLWTTSAFVEPAYAVCRAWGFEPCDLFPWVKRRVLPVEVEVGSLVRRLLRFAIRAEAYELAPRELRAGRWYARGPLQIGGGHRIRHAAEYVLLGIRGWPRSFPTSVRFPGVLEAPAKGRGLRHSSKPAELYRRAELASPAPRVELFAREPREGWTTWGNELAA